MRYSVLLLLTIFQLCRAVDPPKLVDAEDEGIREAMLLREIESALIETQEIKRISQNEISKTYFKYLSTHTLLTSAWVITGTSMRSLAFKMESSRRRTLLDDLKDGILGGLPISFANLRDERYFLKERDPIADR